MRRALIVTVFVFALSFHANAVPKTLAEVAPRPAYPAEAVSRKIQGCGRFQLEVKRATGIPTSVKVLHSTGRKILDEAAVRAFMSWRIHPGTVEHVVVPVCFDFRAGKPTVSY
jgi:TonB family protein